MEGASRRTLAQGSAPWEGDIWSEGSRRRACRRLAGPCRYMHERETAQRLPSRRPRFQKEIAATPELEDALERGFPAGSPGTCGWGGADTSEEASCSCRPAVHPCMPASMPGGSGGRHACPRGPQGGPLVLADAPDPRMDGSRRWNFGGRRAACLWRAALDAATREMKRRADPPLCGDGPQMRPERSGEWLL